MRIGAVVLAMVGCLAPAFLASAALAAAPLAWSVEATPNPAAATASVLSGVSCSSREVCTAVGHFNGPAGAGVLLAERYDGTRWSIESLRKPVGARTSLLFDVSCASPVACTSVGSVTDRSGLTVPLVERRNRSRWTVQRTPDVGSSSHGVSYLGGVSCASSRDCVAVGFSGDATGTVGTPLAERWNGAGWRVQSTPLPAEARVGFLSAVSCTSPRSCVAVGFFISRVGTGEPLAERWNGTRWSIERTPSPEAAVEAQLVGVSCARQGSCMAAGFFSIVTGIQVMMAEHLSGMRWSLQRDRYPRGATGVQFAGVSCPSAGACTAVGYFGGIEGYDDPLAERWDGMRWATQPLPSPAGALSSSLASVSCSSSRACTAVGTSLDDTGTEVTLAERYS
jgi:hypothetical protein